MGMPFCVPGHSGFQALQPWRLGTRLSCDGANSIVLYRSWASFSVLHRPGGEIE
jgi:hypothetical protein